MNYPPSRLKLALTYLLTTPGIPNFITELKLHWMEEVRQIIDD